MKGWKLVPRSCVLSWTTQLTQVLKYMTSRVKIILKSRKTCIFYVKRWNWKGRSGYSFNSIYKIYFAAFLHRSFEVIQIWLTHQSKAMIFYFGMKSFFNLIFENLWKTDKLNFIFWNLECVCKHTLNLNLWNSLCLFSTNFQKSD